MAAVGGAIVAEIAPGAVVTQCIRSRYVVRPLARAVKTRGGAVRRIVGGIYIGNAAAVDGDVRQIVVVLIVRMQQRVVVQFAQIFRIPALGGRATGGATARSWRDRAGTRNAGNKQRCGAESAHFGVRNGRKMRSGRVGGGGQMHIVQGQRPQEAPHRTRIFVIVAVFARAAAVAQRRRERAHAHATAIRGCFFFLFFFVREEFIVLVTVHRARAPAAAFGRIFGF
mmetsp:Transcript_9249/g.15910  ORF Transcript_9249/g.15910 Transcript_9249/m.15910 type:complete len:226 (+) Transcript_9249:1438-2115(+)